jgi:hypothetical protein
MTEQRKRELAIVVYFLRLRELAGGDIPKAAAIHQAITGHEVPPNLISLILDTSMWSQRELTLFWRKRGLTYEQIADTLEISPNKARYWGSKFRPGMMNKLSISPEKIDELYEQIPQWKAGGI